MPEQIAFRKELVSLLPRLRRFALALAGNRDAAEDLVQSAVERALRKWESFESGRSLSSWMYKLMQNIWFDMRRTAAAGPTYMDQVPDAMGEDGREVTESRDELQVVREAFAALPEDQRAVMALVVLDGLSYAQAAETLEVPIGTVMSRLSRARASLASLTRGNTALAPLRLGSRAEARQETRKDD
jgi:RNA polymerase sigma-70 factor, ECF subfamily